VPVTTLADGTALATIVPMSAVYGVFAVNSNFIPFCSIATGSTTNPFAAAPLYSNTNNGPFQSQLGSIVNFAVDGLMIDYIETESLINCKGRK
jgi:hypothetical protein